MRVSLIGFSELYEVDDFWYAVRNCQSYLAYSNVATDALIVKQQQEDAKAYNVKTARLRQTLFRSKLRSFRFDNPGLKEPMEKKEMEYG
jgi:hypothetical protein